jgi:phage gp37-like protein
MFATIETNAIARIKAQVPEFAAVEPYAGQIEDFLLDSPQPSPSCYVTVADVTTEWVDGEETYNDKVTLAVLVFIRDPRGPGVATAGLSGSYALIRKVRHALTGQRLGLDMERLKPTGNHLVVATKDKRIDEVDFETSYDHVYEEEA